MASPTVLALASDPAFPSLPGNATLVEECPERVAVGPDGLLPAQVDGI